MQIAILGYGVEGKAVEKYFRSHDPTVDLTIFDKFTIDDLPELSGFDLVFRTPSVNPRLLLEKQPGIHLTSVTEYFFDHVDRRRLIGVTGTKGKGTTCSLTTALLKSLGYQVFLVGNIGTPALDVLPEIDRLEQENAQVSPKSESAQVALRSAQPTAQTATKGYFVVYEMSSFQLWTLQKSPHVSVVLRISPDHLDVHKDFNEYVTSKSNITSHQTKDDFCIFYSKNPDSQKIAECSKGTLIPYPFITTFSEADAKPEVKTEPEVRNNPETVFTPQLSPAASTTLKNLLDALAIPGAHNRENAEAALAATAAALGLDLETLLKNHADALKTALANFKSLPHRIQFVREVNGVRYYDDNYSSALPAADVAIKAFSDSPVVLIAGGKDRHLDFSEHQHTFFDAPNVQKVILIGEIKEKLAKNQAPEKYELADTLDEAVAKARAAAESLATKQNPTKVRSAAEDLVVQQNPSETPVVLMSPAAPSFDMFENFNARGAEFQKLVEEIPLMSTIKSADLPPKTRN